MAYGGARYASIFRHVIKLVSTQSTKTVTILGPASLEPAMAANIITQLSGSQETKTTKAYLMKTASFTQSQTHLDR